MLLPSYPHIYLQNAKWLLSAVNMQKSGCFSRNDNAFFFVCSFDVIKANAISPFRA